jgi:hypothetical protein
MLPYLTLFFPLNIILLLFVISGLINKYRMIILNFKFKYINTTGMNYDLVLILKFSEVKIVVIKIL